MYMYLMWDDICSKLDQYKVNPLAQWLIKVKRPCKSSKKGIVLLEVVKLLLYDSEAKS